MNWTINEIQKLINTNAEESLHMDFKASGSLDKSDKKKAEITKDVSSFANSNGGIIIYGLKEINHVAQEISLIDGTIYTKEWLEQIINAAIQPKIEGIVISPIRLSNEIEQSIYVVEIPESADSPHMAKDKKFYKRHNFESVPMEEYEVKRLYFRPSTAKLEIVREIIGVQTVDDSPNVIDGISLSVKIKNIGNTVEDKYKFQIEFPTIHMLFMSCEGTMHYTNSTKTHITYSTKESDPIFQDEELILGQVIYNFQNHSVNTINVDLDIIITLYFSSGTCTKRVNLKEVYEKAIEVHSDSSK